MPCLFRNFDFEHGPILEVAIEAMPNDPCNPHVYNALIDTGASKTCISQRVVDEVGLMPSGKRMLKGVTSEADVFKYGCLIGFQHMDSVSKEMMTTNMPVDASAIPFYSRNFDVLIGRDILCQGVFTMSFDGHFTFSY